nr:hypothetical protein [Neisseriaceae bacterium]
KVTYTPNAGYDGPDEFEYTVKDNDGLTSNPAKVEIDVTPRAVGNVSVTLDESALDGTTGQAVMTGEIVQDNPDGKDAGDMIITPPTTALTSNGEPITWEQDGKGALVGKTPAGEPVITVTLGEPVTENGKTTVSYEVTLNGPVDHAEGSDELTLDIGLSNNVGELGLGVTVTDDVPVVENVGVSVSGDLTFYANAIISLDVSNSMMTTDSGVYIEGKQQMRMQVALDAVETMLDKYQEQLDSVLSKGGQGEVKVNMSVFANSAKHITLDGSTEYWMTLDKAKALVKNLQDLVDQRVLLGDHYYKVGSGTNYDAALQEVVNTYLDKGTSNPVDHADVKNDFYFMTDGRPAHFNPYGNPGIAEGSTPNYKPGSAETDIGREEWIKFLQDHKITSTAIGIGPEMFTPDTYKAPYLTGEEYIRPVGFDGVTGTDDPKYAIALKEMSDLSDILAGLVPDAHLLSGNLGGAGFGADSAGTMSLVVDGETYTYAYESNQLSSTADASQWKEISPGVVQMTTSTGGVLTMGMGGDKFGQYTYKPAGSRPAGVAEETFDITLTDKDGDAANGKITIDLKDLPEQSATGRSAKMLAADFEDLPVFNQVEDPIAAFAKVPAHEPEVNSGGSSMAQQLDQWVTDQSAIV